MSGRRELGRGAVLAAALILSAAAGCSEWKDGDPAPRAVRPASGQAGVPIAIRIEGDGLGARVHADFGDASGSYVESGWVARLGGTRLRDVRPTGDGALEAIVPESLAAGAHDLVVVSPSGREAALPSAYRALASAATGGVAAFRFAAVGAQQAMRPFAVTITALDADGNVATEFSGTVEVTSAAGSVLPGTVGPFAWGVWTGELELRGAAPAVVLAAADGAGASGASAPFAVAAVPAARVAFASPAIDAVAGACSPVDVALEDAFGAPTVPAAPLAVSLSADRAGPGFFADPACTTPAAAVTVPAGASAARVHARSTVAGSFTLAASGGALAPAQQPASFRAAASDRLAFTTAPQVVGAGECSGVATVEAQDAFGNATPMPAVTVVALAAGGPGLSFHAGPGCAGVPVPSIAIAAGASAASFSFRGTAAGTVTVTAAGAGIAAPASQDETISPASPDRLVFTTAPQVVTAGECSAAATVEARDPFGNAAPVSTDVPVALGAAPGAGFALHAGAGCAGAPAESIAMASGTSSVTFSFRGTAAGTVTVTAAGAGIATPASQDETVSPAPPDRLAFTTGAQTATAGACSVAATVEARDPFGNVSAPAVATDVALAAVPGEGFVFYAGGGCAGAPVPSVAMAAGTSSATFSFRGTAAGGVLVTATGAGLPLPASRTETIAAAEPARLVFTTDAQTVAAGACSAEARVEARDAYGNAATAAADLPVSLAGAPAAGLTFHAAPGCGGASVGSVALAAGASAASFWFQGTSAGAVTVTAAAAGVPGAADQLETIEPGAAAALRWDAIASPQAAGIPFPVTVRAVDAHGNATPAFGGTAALSAAPPSLACLSGCSAGLDTIPFAAGVWSGEVALASGGTGVRLAAVSGALSGTSDPFDVVAVAYRVGSFVKSTGAAPASQVVTHDLGTLPKAVILWTAGHAVETPQGDHTYAHGISDGTASFSFGAGSDGGVSPSNASRRVAAKALTMVGWGETVLAEADLAGWTASTFTLAWTTNDARPVVVHYLVVGGETVQAKVASWQMPTKAGSRTVAGIGFSPDLVLHLHAATSLTGAPPSMATRAAVGIGAMNRAGEQWALLVGADDASSPAEARRIQRTDTALVSISIQGGIDAEGSLASMDADGFTMSFSTARGAGQVASLALKGVASRVGSFSKATAPGSQSVSGGTFRPSALVLASDDAAASSQMQLHAQFAFGAFDGTRAASAALLDQSGVLTTDVRGVDRTAKAFSTVGVAGIEDEADVTSLDPAGFTLGWTASDAAASQMLYLALAPPSPAAGPAMLAAAPAPVAAGPLAAFAWDAVPSPQPAGGDFPVTVRALDASGSVVASYGGTAALDVLPAGLGLECTQRCSGAATTAAFEAGIWSGRIRIASEAAGVVLTAASGATAGASAPFDVLGVGPAATAAGGGQGAR